MALSERAFDALLALMDCSGRTLSARELLTAVCPGLPVTTAQMRVVVSGLRRQIGPEYIAVSPAGYRFVRAHRSSTALRPPSPGKPGEAPLRGRGSDITDTARLVRRHRLVTLTGAGGVGKTRLARALVPQLQADFAGGVHWHDVARSPGPLPPQAGPAPQRSLLILDGMEHAVDTLGPSIVHRLEAAPDTHLLLTSQVPLRVSGEIVVKLMPLTVPAHDATLQQLAHSEAIALFIERARTRDPQFRLDASNVETVVGLCQLTDGLPLGLELAAAAMVTGASMQEDCGVACLTRTAGCPPMTHKPPRHATLLAAVAWSHQLLDQRARTVFLGLALLPRVFALETARDVLADEHLDEWDILDALGDLVELSILRVDLHAHPCYSMSEAARAFALAQLDAARSEPAMRQRLDAARARAARHHPAPSAPLRKSCHSFAGYLPGVESPGDHGAACP